MSNKTIRRAIISGGGTGGHIFPALSIADTLKRRFPEVEILFVGAQGRMEMDRVPKAGYQIVGLEVEGLSRSKPWRNFGILYRYLRSITRARAIIRDFAPDVVIGVGGYASAPTLRAAQSLGIPTLIQEQNSYAGLTNKMLAKRARRICVAYPDMDRYFPADRIVVTGNPIRTELEQMHCTRSEALEHFCLPTSTGRTVLVIGGSLGARTINQSIAQQLAQWEASGITLIWQTGKLYAEEAQALLASYPKLSCYCRAFIERMDLAYHLADVVVSRAGASSISELCILGKPSILVPSPNVAEDHQTKNALALSSRDAALMIADADAIAQLSAQALALVQDQARCQKLSERIQQMALPQAAERIVDELLALI